MELLSCPLFLPSLPMYREISLIGRVCAATGATSYGDAWAKTIGKGTAWVPSSSCTFKTFFACMIYSIIVGQFSFCHNTFAIRHIELCRR